MQFNTSKPIQYFRTGFRGPWPPPKICPFKNFYCLKIIVSLESYTFILRFIQNEKASKSAYSTPARFKKPKNVSETTLTDASYCSIDVIIMAYVLSNVACVTMGYFSGLSCRLKFSSMLQKPQVLSFHRVF